MLSPTETRTAHAMARDARELDIRHDGAPRHDYRTDYAAAVRHVTTTCRARFAPLAPSVRR